MAEGQVLEPSNPALEPSFPRPTCVAHLHCTSLPGRWVTAGTVPAWSMCVPTSAVFCYFMRMTYTKTKGLGKN